MSEERESSPSCAVCGRRLLAGEHPTAYVTRDGVEAIICELCKPRAEAAGWLRPDEADAVRAAGGGRDRRRPRGQMLGGLLSRLPAQPNAPSGADTERGGEGRPAARTEERRPPAPAEEGEGQATTMQQALAAFNASNHRRTVAGLTRTLGPPRASGLAVRVKGDHPGVRLTVAWELTWYQWEVGPGGSGPEVRESGKGDTIDQLRAADCTWNLMVDNDGTLEQRSAAVGSAGEGGAG